ncbi:asparagine synthetase B family protein [Oleiphilus messinensis]|nr:asparagine synthase C-terminal domain-containing protein [Oleiphilus messinensis]
MHHFIGSLGSFSPESEDRFSIPVSGNRRFSLQFSGNMEMSENEDGILLVTTGATLKADQDQPDTPTAATNSDRLLAYLTGTDANILKGIQGLSGHFCLVYFSKKSEQLILATDKIGTHPVYYAEYEDGLIFSSKLKQLVTEAPQLKKIDPQGIYQYIYFHCIPAPDTIYQQVKKLQSSEALQFKNSTITRNTYYVPEFKVSTEQAPEQQKKLFTALQHSVERSLAGCEIEETGAFLSGGLDSSTVSGFFAKSAAPQKAKTFTIGFEAEGYDESAFAKITADLFDTDHSVYYVTPEDIKSALTRISAYYDEPFGNSSALPALYCAEFAKQKGITTLLAGDGGDELFAGNERYAKQKVFELYYKIPSPIRRIFLEAPLSLLPENVNIPILSKAASYVKQARIKLPGRLQTYNFLHQFDPSTVFTESLLNQVDRKRPLTLLEQRYNEPGNGDSQNRMLYLDWKFTLADNDLVKVTNMCNLAGVDVRYPMLDDELLELSTQIASETLLPGNDLRRFYKEATRGFLSDKTLDKSKKGFGLPFGVWLKETPELRDMAYANVRALKDTGFFKEPFLEHAIKMHSSDHPGYFGELIWILMMLNMWLASH